MQETTVRFLGQEDPLEKGKAIHSSILAWKIPWTEEPGGVCGVAQSRTRLSKYYYHYTVRVCSGEMRVGDVTGDSMIFQKLF